MKHLTNKEFERVCDLLKEIEIKHPDIKDKICEIYSIFFILRRLPRRQQHDRVEPAEADQVLKGRP